MLGGMGSDVGREEVEVRCYCRLGVPGVLPTHCSAYAKYGRYRKGSMLKLYGPSLCYAIPYYMTLRYLGVYVDVIYNVITSILLKTNSSI